jgi:phthalate 4,5-dioxygenase
VKGITNQDIVMWESMGPVVDRTHDRLGASDLAIVEFRKQMVEAARTVAAGGPAIGTTSPRVPLAKLQSFEGVVPKSADWRQLGATPEELAVNAEHEKSQGTRQAAE